MLQIAPYFVLEGSDKSVDQAKDAAVAAARSQQDKSPDALVFGLFVDLKHKFFGLALPDPIYGMAKNLGAKSRIVGMDFILMILGVLADRGLEPDVIRSLVKLQSSFQTDFVDRLDDFKKQISNAEKSAQDAATAADGAREETAGLVKSATDEASGYASDAQTAKQDAEQVLEELRSELTEVKALKGKLDQAEGNDLSELKSQVSELGDRFGKIEQDLQADDTEGASSGGDELSEQIAELGRKLEALQGAGGNEPDDVFAAEPQIDEGLIRRIVEDVMSEQSMGGMDPSMMGAAQ